MILTALTSLLVTVPGAGTMPRVPACPKQPAMFKATKCPALPPMIAGAPGTPPAPQR